MPPVIRPSSRRSISVAMVLDALPPPAMKMCSIPDRSNLWPVTVQPIAVKLHRIPDHVLRQDCIDAGLDDRQCVGTLLVSPDQVSRSLIFMKNVGLHCKNNFCIGKS